MEQETKTNPASVEKEAQYHQNRCTAVLVARQSLYCSYPGFGCFYIIVTRIFKSENIVIMSKHVAINALLAIGMTFVILTGGIDLSVGSLVGMTAMIAGGLINEGIILPQLGIIIYPHTWMIIVISLALGTLMGAIQRL